MLMLMLVLVLILVHGLGVERWNIAPARVTVSKPGDIRCEGAVRKPSITVGRLRGMALESAVRIPIATLANRSVEVLHAEKMRGDKRVPPNVR